MSGTRTADPYRVNLGFMDYRQFRREDYESDPDMPVIERVHPMTS
jgi:hypothetical protein